MLHGTSPHSQPLALARVLTCSKKDKSRAIRAAMAESARLALDGSKTRGGSDEHEIVIADGSRSIAMQTAYRDGDAQTDPFTPDYVIPPGTEPEVARLTFLKFGGEPGKSLPIGRKDVEVVEAARVRHEIETHLPPMTDEASFHVRKRLMEDLELEAFLAREADMDVGNAQRLQLVESALSQRDADRSFVVDQRVEDLRRKLEIEKEQQLAALQAKRVKTLRKLGKARKIEERHVDMLTGTGSFLGVGPKHPVKSAGAGKLPKPTRDIISEYAEYGSKVYAPLRREGFQLDKLRTAARFEAGTGAESLRDAGGLANLAATLPLSATTASIARPNLTKPVSTTARADELIARDLDNVYSMIQTVKAGKSTTAIMNEEVPAWRKPKPQVERPSTPSFDDVDESPEQAHFEQAVVLLQSMLRGRSVQNVMFEGKERRLELITEMRADLLTEEAAAALAVDEGARRRDRDVVVARDAVADAAAGEVAAAAFDYFSKELTRSREMSRISALAAAADAERERRESEELARRYAEIHRNTVNAAVEQATASVYGAAAHDIVTAALRAAVVDHANEVAGHDTGLVAEALGPIVAKLEAEAAALEAGLRLAPPLELVPTEPAGKAQQDAAAVRIQAVARGRQARKEVGALRSASLSAAAVSSSEESQSPDAAVAGPSLTLSAESLSAEEPADSPGSLAQLEQVASDLADGSIDSHSAATRIQAIARGRAARKQVGFTPRRGGGAASVSDSPAAQSSADAAPAESGSDTKVDEMEAVAAVMAAGAIDSHAAATRIQSIARGRAARKQVQSLRPSPRSDAAAESAAESKQNEELEQVAADVENGLDSQVAATRIQAIARGRGAKKQVQALKSPRTEAAERAEAAAESKENEQLEAVASAVEAGLMDPQAAATRIQSIARGRAARRQVVALRTPRQSDEAVNSGAEEGKEEDVAAVETQQQEQLEAVATLVAGGLDPQVAATRIQAIARGRAARQKVHVGGRVHVVAPAAAPTAASSSPAEPAAAAEESKQQDEQQHAKADAAADDVHQEAAATKIQAIARGRAARKQVKGLVSPPAEAAAAAAQDVHQHPALGVDETVTSLDLSAASMSLSASGDADVTAGSAGGAGLVEGENIISGDLAAVAEAVAE